MNCLNKELRLKIVDMICKSGEGHIPSSFSIVDILNFLYSEILKFDLKNLNSVKRDFFILSKGHGCAALYVVLNKFKIISDKDISNYGLNNGILGGHPDMTKVPGVEASTGSLGHGFPTAVGISLGLKIKKMNNRVFVLLGDGECHEGTVWETANIARNQNLNNIIAIVDLNKSAAQLMPFDNLKQKWISFGWDVFEADGHSNISLKKTFRIIFKSKSKNPKIILASTIKGKGVPFLEGHGKWHHKIPNQDEYLEIKKKLS